MNRRSGSLLVALLVVSTVGFVAGVSIERSSGDGHHEAAVEAVESSEASEEGHADEASSQAEGDEDESVLGVDLEATAFVALAAAISLALALAVWVRPRWALLLGLIAAAMLAFAALDVREVVHQLDEDRSGVALLAAAVAGLHLAALAVTVSMARTPARDART